MCKSGLTGNLHQKRQQKHIFGIQPVSVLPVLDKIQDLEKRVEHSEHFPSNLDHQAAVVLKEGKHVINGPNTPIHYAEFSFGAVMFEIRTHAPDVYQLSVQLSRTHRNVASADEFTVDQFKAVTSVYTTECTLCKGKRDTIVFKLDAYSRRNWTTGKFLHDFLTLHNLHVHLYLGLDSPQPCWSVHVL